jgi:hypothetical protein
MEPRFTVNAGAPPDPVPFEIVGTDRHGESWTEPFTARATLTLAETLALGDDEIVNTAWQVAFIRSVLLPEDADRFDALIADTDRLIEAPTIWQIVARLAEEMTGRPTSPPVASPNGATPTGDTSTGGSPSPEPDSATLTVVAS